MLVILINDIAVFQRRKPLLLDQLGNARIQHAADLRAFQYLEFLPVVHAERGDAVAGGVKDLFLKRIRFGVAHFVPQRRHDELYLVVYLLYRDQIILVDLILGDHAVFDAVPLGRLRLDDRKFFKTAYHIQSKRPALCQKHNRLVPEILGAVMVVQPDDTVARLTDIDLRNIVILILVDEIIDARTFDARDVFRLPQQRPWNHIGRHRRKAALHGANTVRLDRKSVV